MYAEEVGEDLNDKEIETIRKSIRGDCCVLEVILRLALAVNEMVNMTDEDQTPKFVEKMLENGGFNRYDEEDWDENPEIVSDFWHKCLKKLFSDERKTSLWQKMNDWVDEHTNEDGVWVD